MHNRESQHWLKDRVVWIALVLMTIAAGLLVRKFIGGAPGKCAGVALYAVMMVWIVQCVRPHLGTVRTCGIALLVCWAIEGFQATGVPTRINGALPGARLVFGEVFAWADMVWYGVGVLAAGTGSWAAMAGRGHRCREA